MPSLTSAPIKTKKAPCRKKAAPKKPVRFTPQWEGPIEGWVVNGMRGNYFRVESTMTREDYMQEAFLVFLRLSTRYEVEEPQHMMALFKTAWSRRLNDLANNDTEARRCIFLAPRRNEEGEEMDPLETIGELDNGGVLALMVREAPPDVAAVLNLFLSAPQALLESALASWRGEKDRRFKNGGSGHICALLGLDPGLDVMARVEEYFSA